MRAEVLCQQNKDKLNNNTMKNDKLLEHQVKRLHRLLLSEIGLTSWGSISTKGKRIMDMISKATLRSLARHRMSILNF